MDPIVMPLVITLKFGVTSGLAGALPMLVVVRLGVVEV